MVSPCHQHHSSPSFILPLTWSIFRWKCVALSFQILLGLPLPRPALPAPCFDEHLKLDGDLLSLKLFLWIRQVITFYVEVTYHLHMDLDKFNLMSFNCQIVI